MSEITRTVSKAERVEILDRAVATYVRHGYRVQLNDGQRAVVSRRQRVMVFPNVVLAVLTGGLWVIVLAVRLLNWPVDQVALTVDEYGLLVPEFSS